MTSNTNNNSGQSETLDQLCKMLLYKKKDIIAIQEKLDISDKAQMTIYQSKKAKTLADSYELLLDLVGNLILIQENLNIDDNPILAVEYQSNEASTEISLGEIFNLLMYLEEDIIAI